MFDDPYRAGGRSQIRRDGNPFENNLNRNKQRMNELENNQYQEHRYDLKERRNKVLNDFRGESKAVDLDDSIMQMDPTNLTKSGQFDQLSSKSNLWENMGTDERRNRNKEDYKRHVKDQIAYFKEKSKSRSRSRGKNQDESISRTDNWNPENFRVGALPMRDEIKKKDNEYASLLRSQIEEKKRMEQIKKQLEIERDKKLVAENILNSPFDNFRGIPDYGSKRGEFSDRLVGVGSSILNLRNSYPNIDISSNSAYNSEAIKNSMYYNSALGASEVSNMKQKRANQQNELARYYEEQIAEKERRKMEEKRKAQLEDLLEEQRFQREKQELDRQNLENQRKQEELRLLQNKFNQNAINQASKTELMMPSVNNILPTMSNLNDKGMDKSILSDNVIINSLPKDVRLEELPVNATVELQKAVSNAIKYTLGEELDKIKKEVSNHSVLLREQLLTLKSQALLAEELKHHAQLELSKFRDDLKYQQSVDEMLERDLYSKMGESFLRSKITPPVEYVDKEFKFPQKPKGYQSFGKNDDGLEELDFQVNYLPGRGERDNDLLYKNKKDNLENYVKVENARYLSKDQDMDRFDYAKLQFESMFPENRNFGNENRYYKEAKVAQYLRSTEAELTNSNQTQKLFKINEDRLNYLNDFQNPKEEIDEYGKSLNQYLISSKDNLFEIDD